MDFTFAELLPSYHERASFSQAELAATLGIHRNTPSGWGRGAYHPRDPEQVLMLAEELALTANFIASSQGFRRRALKFIGQAGLYPGYLRLLTRATKTAQS